MIGLLNGPIRVSHGQHLRIPSVFVAMSNASQVTLVEIKDKENSRTAAKPQQCGRRVATDLCP
jgi:hypothetical protein